MTVVATTPLFSLSIQIPLPTTMEREGGFVSSRWPFDDVCVCSFVLSEEEVNSRLVVGLLEKFKERERKRKGKKEKGVGFIQMQLLAKFLLDYLPKLGRLDIQELFIPIPISLLISTTIRAIANRQMYSTQPTQTYT